MGLLRSLGRVLMEAFTQRSGPGMRQLIVMETLSLGAKRQLILVRCGEEHFLVGASSDGVTSMVNVSQRREDRGVSDPRKHP